MYHNHHQTYTRTEAQAICINKQTYSTAQHTQYSRYGVLCMLRSSHPSCFHSDGEIMCNTHFVCRVCAHVHVYVPPCMSVSAFSIFALTMCMCVCVCLCVIFVLTFNELLNVLWRNSNDVSQHLHVNTDTNENALTLIKCNLIFVGSHLHGVCVYVSHHANVCYQQEHIHLFIYFYSLFSMPSARSQFSSFGQWKLGHSYQSTQKNDFNHLV